MPLSKLIEQIKSNKKLMNYINSTPRVRNFVVYILTAKLVIERGTWRLFITYLYNTTVYYLFKKQKDVTIDVYGYNITMPNHMKAIDGVIEVMCDDFYQRIQDCKHVLDLWWYIGESALRLAKQNEKVTVYEAHPENYVYLLKNCASIPNIIPHQAAVVWNNQPSLELYGWSFNMWASEQKSQNMDNRSVTVPCKNIIDILRNGNFDAMKMDIEWGEFSCMEAIMNVSNDIFLQLKIWCIECHILWDEQRGEQTRKIITWLQKQKYTVSCIDAVTNKQIWNNDCVHADIVLVVFEL
jgi:FkbM family methyltransferase